MKIRVAVLFIFTILLSCDSLKVDTSPEFPACKGTKESFNPSHIPSSYYSGKIGSNDKVIYANFIFTHFVDYNYLLSAERSWNMWIRFTSGDTTKYQSSYCYYTFTDPKWYASTGFDFEGQYTWWDFHFETFTCPRLSGSLDVV